MFYSMEQEISVWGKGLRDAYALLTPDAPRAYAGACRKFVRLQHGLRVPYACLRPPMPEGAATRITPEAFDFAYACLTPIETLLAPDTCWSQGPSTSLTPALR